jgi:hypothetical protein
MDINTPLKRTPVLLFGAPKPDYSTYDRITSGCVCSQYLAGRLPSVKDRSGRSSRTDLGCDLQMSERSLPTSKIIPFPVTRG